MANSLIDFGVVNPEASESFLKGFQGAQALAQQQAQQQRQNALADLQLRGAQRGEEEALAEREAYKNQDPLAALRAAGLGEQALAYQKTLDEQTAAKLKQATDIHKLVSDSLRGVAALGTRESAQGALANAKARGLDVSQYEAELAQTPDTLISKWALSHAAGADKALEQQFVDLGVGTVAGPKYATGSPTAQPTAPTMRGMPAGIPGQTSGGRIAGTNALALPTPGGVMPAAQPYAVPGGGMMYPKGMSQVQQATDTREQQRIALEQRRVELAEKEAQRKTQGLEALPPKEIQKREAAFPQATSAIKGFETKSESFIKDLKALRDDPGLDQITGAIYGRTPSVSREGSRAQALYDKVTAKGGFQALQDLRDASKTGGALGNVSNQEGKQLTASFAAIDRRQAKEDVQAAIDQAIADVEGSKTRMREAYDSTYSYKTPAAAPAAPAAPAAGGGNWKDL